jgi:hypothetical protein
MQQLEGLLAGIGVLIVTGIAGLVTASITGWPSHSIQTQAIIAPLSVGAVIGLVIVYLLLLLSPSRE